MTHQNRSRLTVDLDGAWRLYSTIAPPGSTPLGIVRRENGESGVLARIEQTGIYVQINAGVIRTLDQRKVISAIKSASGVDNRGAATQMEDGRRINLYMDAASIATAERIGSGNISAGIRMALKNQGAQPS